MRTVLALILSIATAMAQPAPPVIERAYLPRDLGIDCVRAPCPNWEARDAETGVAVRFAGIEWAMASAPDAATLANLAAGRLIVRGQLIEGRYPPPDSRVPVLRITAIIGVARR